MKVTVITPTIRGRKALRRATRSLKNQTLVEHEWIVKDHNPKEPPNFNKAMNDAIREANGELIVFLQDYIRISRNGLYKFWKAYNKEKDVFWTAPVGQTLDDVDIRWDWRKHRIGKCSFLEWEIDWACAPKEALVKIGGFDEELDQFWGFDNVNVALRAQLAGYKFKNMPDNKAVAQDHRKFEEHPYQHLRNPDFHNQRLDEFRMGLTLNNI